MICKKIPDRCVCACVVRYSRGKHRKPRHCCYRIWIWSPKPELYIVLDEMKFVQYLPFFLFSLCMNIWINLHWQHWCTKIVLIMQISKATDAGQHPIVMRCTVSTVLNLHLSLSLFLYISIYRSNHSKVSRFCSPVGWHSGPVPVHSLNGSFLQEMIPSWSPDVAAGDMKKACSSLTVSYRLTILRKELDLCILSMCVCSSRLS